MVKQFVDNTQSQALFVLALVTGIFVPLQFLTGVYGMNWDNMPELHHKEGYFTLWGILAFIGIASVIYFWHDGWFTLMSQMKELSQVRVHGPRQTWCPCRRRNKM